MLLFGIIDTLYTSGFRMHINDATSITNLVIMLFFFWTIPSSPVLTLMHRLVHHEELATTFDERFRLIWQLSAATALYWALFLIFVFGSLYDIMVTRQWPLRSVVETVVIFIIWTLAYRHREKRM
jgi:ABC-type sulfate transport system permease component